VASGSPLEGGAEREGISSLSPGERAGVRGAQRRRPDTLTLTLSQRERESETNGRAMWKDHHQRWWLPLE